MPINEELTKYTEELTKYIEKSLDSKPVYAVAGAGDFAVEKLRELSARLSTLSNVRVESKDVQDQVGAVQKDIWAKLQALQNDAQVRFAHVQEAIRELPEQAQAVVTVVTTTANDVYGDLAERGENVVGRIRHQQSTEDMKDQAQSTVRRAKATRTTAAKGVTATKRAAKGTVTSAKKTVEAAEEAASDATDNIG